MAIKGIVIVSTTILALLSLLLLVVGFKFIKQYKENKTGLVLITAALFLTTLAILLWRG